MTSAGVRIETSRVPRRWQRKDVYLFNITGQNYTTEHDVYDATGFLTTLIRKHADGSMAFKLVQSKDGTKTTDWYDAKGVLTSEVITKADGYSSTTVYTNGVKTAAYITNADLSQDNYTYNITGQSYATQHQHLDPTGKTTEVTRWHADGTLDYTQVVGSDGSSVVTNYDASGIKKRRPTLPRRWLEGCPPLQRHRSELHRQSTTATIPPVSSPTSCAPTPTTAWHSRLCRAPTAPRPPAGTTPRELSPAR